MKKIIALAAIIASAQASAFWDSWDSSNGSATGNYNGAADMVGNGTGEGEATFSMNFTGKGRSAGDFKGNGNTAGDFSGYGYESSPYGAPMMAPAAPVAPAAK